MTPEEVYKNWRDTLKKPNDSIFYYHSGLERILLGLSIFVLTPQPAFAKLDKAVPLWIFHKYVPDLITAWIDDKGDDFKSVFDLTMVVSESYLLAANEYARQHQSKRKVINTIMAFFAAAASAGGDVHPHIAEELLDDLSTDGSKIYSTKIAAFGTRLLALSRQYGIDIPPSRLQEVLGRG